jgi:formate dehydrogenase
MAKVLCVLHPDPTDGYPPPPVREGLPQRERYPDGRTSCSASS